MWRPIANKMDFANYIGDIFKIRSKQKLTGDYMDKCKLGNTYLPVYWYTWCLYNRRYMSFVFLNIVFKDLTGYVKIIVQR